MKVKMNQPVNWGDEIATPRQMIDAGKASVVVVDRFKATNRGKVRKATFVETPTGQCVEVSRYVTA